MGLGELVLLGRNDQLQQLRHSLGELNDPNFQLAAFFGVGDELSLSPQLVAAEQLQAAVNPGLGGQ